jgi:glycine amidinotransferase
MNESSLSEPSSVVWSHNEWDLLEEVIVGRVDGAYLPKWDQLAYGMLDPDEQQIAHALQAQPFPAEVIAAAQDAVDSLIHILQAEGVRVRRPELHDFGKSYATPDWEWPCGYHAANPRDVLIVFGDEILEVPTPRRHRHYEVLAYRALLAEYARQGARWEAAPKPRIKDDLYVKNFPRPREHAPIPPESERYPITEVEPVFDAADFMRCGQDIFYQRSFVTNQFGVDWLRRHLGPRYRFHEIRSACYAPVHIDTTFVPLAPGKALANPEFMKEVPDVLKKWDLLWAPEPVAAKGGKSPFQFDSWWLSMNVLSIDEERVLVDSLQETLIRQLRDWGFKPIPIAFQSYFPFAGGLHCATLDVRRRGTLKSYF